MVTFPGLPTWNSHLNLILKLFPSSSPEYRISDNFQHRYSDLQGSPFKVLIQRDPNSDKSNENRNPMTFGR